LIFQPNPAPDSECRDFFRFLQISRAFCTYSPRSRMIGNARVQNDENTDHLGPEHEAQRQPTEPFSEVIATQSRVNSR